MTQPELAKRNSGFGGRGYQHPHNNSIVPSVTTILKAAAKPAIEQWVADQTAAYAVANIDALLTRTEMQGYNMLRWYHKRNPLPLEDGYDPRNYYLGVLNDAAELGTTMHGWIEADVDPEFVYPDVEGETDLFWQMHAVWDDWFSENIITPVMTETTVWNATLGYAGTFDCLWEINGELWFLDIKTARSLWPEHSMQLAALRNAETVLTKDNDSWVETEWSLPDSVKFGFLHIRPDDVEYDGTPKPAYIELEPAEDLDLHWEGFQGLLQAKKAEIAIKERHK